MLNLQDYHSLSFIWVIKSVKQSKKDLIISNKLEENLKFYHSTILRFPKIFLTVSLHIWLMLTQLSHWDLAIQTFSNMATQWKFLQIILLVWKMSNNWCSINVHLINRSVKYWQILWWEWKIWKFLKSMMQWILVWEYHQSSIIWPSVKIFPSLIFPDALSLTKMR